MKLKQAQKGSIIIFAVMIMAALITILTSVTAVFIPKIRLIRETSSSVTALYAADSVIEWCIFEARQAGDVSGPGTPGVPAGGALSGTMPSGATYRIDKANPPLNADICPLDEVLGHRAVGTYIGVSRALEVGEVN